jgi:hypothetical protein
VEQSTQRGFLRFVGLPPNDPAKPQYQLWIFDRRRDQAYPVDGGVFDATSTGEVAVCPHPQYPFAGKLRVDAAALFAVTVERPAASWYPAASTSSSPPAADAAMATDPAAVQYCSTNPFGATIFVTSH